MYIYKETNKLLYIDNSHDEISLTSIKKKHKTLSERLSNYSKKKLNKMSFGLIDLLEWRLYNMLKTPLVSN